MLGPLPTGSRFIQVGVSKCYGTPTAYAQQVAIGAKGFSRVGQISSFNFKRPDYLGAKLPFSSTGNVLITSAGPFYSPPINYTLKSNVSLFDATDMLGVLSGVHEVQALIVTVDDLLLSITGDSTATIFPFMNGHIGGLFTSVAGEGLIGAALNMQALADTVGNFADGSTSTSATITFMLGEYNTFNLAVDANAYLFTYNLTIGPFKSAACLAW